MASRLPLRNTTNERVVWFCTMWTQPGVDGAALGDTLGDDVGEPLADVLGDVLGNVLGDMLGKGGRVAAVLGTGVIPSQQSRRSLSAVGQQSPDRC